MRYNLLEMVQIILSAMGSDEVDSIQDTSEAYQVAQLLRTVFYDVATEIGLPEHDSLIQLNSSLSVSLPCVMTVPTTAARIDSIAYDISDYTASPPDTRGNWKTIQYLPLSDFFAMQNGFSESTDSNVMEMLLPVDGVNHRIICLTDRAPSWYTTFNDTTILFDSYDSEADDTLQQSKTRCYGSTYPVFTLSDTFTPPLDPTQFSYYLNKAKVRAFYEIKQQENAEAAAEARRQKTIMTKRQHRVATLTDFQRRPHYGRK